MGRKGCNQSPIALDSIGLTDGLADGSPAHSTDLGRVFLRVGVLLHAFLFASGIHTTRPLSSQNVLLLARTLNHLDRLVMVGQLSLSFLSFFLGLCLLFLWETDMRNRSEWPSADLAEWASYPAGRAGSLYPKSVSAPSSWSSFVFASPIYC